MLNANKIRFVQKLLLQIMLFIFLITQISLAQWYQQNSGTTNSLRGVFFTGPMIGFSVGGLGSILKTVDGGLNWLPQNSGTYNFLASVYFVDANIGWVCGQNGIIKKTTDGGYSWVAQSSGTSNPLWSIYFVNSNTGWAVGDTGTVVRTSNGGANWSLQTNLISDDFLSVYFNDSNTGWAVGDAGWVFKTTDGGMTWIISQVGPWWLHSVYFTSSNTGYAAGYSGTILKTDNAGSSWAPYSTDTTAGFLEVCFVNSDNGWAVGENGIIYNTTNAGQSWNLQASGTLKKLFSVFFTDQNNGWAVGNDGIILKYGDVLNEASSYKNNLNLPISDFNTTEDIITINLENFNLLSRTLVGGKVFIDTVLHSSDSDLEFMLTHNGVIDTIIYKVGGSGDNFISTQLHDAAFTPIANGSAPFTGEFQPSFPLSKFGGLDPNGEWKLSIYDGITGNTGVLKAWGIELIFLNTTDMNEGGTYHPEGITLYQNYPNPFNPSTIISYQLPVGGIVLVKVYDILGNEIATLVDEYKPAGKYDVKFNASSLSSGVYFYQLKAGEFIGSKKMLLLK